MTGRRNKVVLYPGNVSVLNPEVKQLVTVFGRVKDRRSGYYANADIHNHIGKRAPTNSASSPWTSISASR